jgi:hypothetical protein
MRDRKLLRAGIKMATAAITASGLVKLIAYDRANRAPDPATLPYPTPPPPGLRPDGTFDPRAGVGVFGADGESLTDGHGNPVLLRLSDLTLPTVPPWGMQLPPDPVGTVRRVKRGWFGRVTEIVEAPPAAPTHYRLGDDNKVHRIDDPNAPGLTPLGSTPPIGDSHLPSPSWALAPREAMRGGTELTLRKW